MKQRSDANVLCAYCYGWTRNLSVVSFPVQAEGGESQIHLHEGCVISAKENGFTYCRARYRFDEVSCSFVPVGLTFASR